MEKSNLATLVFGCSVVVLPKPSSALLNNRAFLSHTSQSQSERLTDNEELAALDIFALEVAEHDAQAARSCSDNVVIQHGD